jgi:hypothetical protein
MSESKSTTAPRHVTELAMACVEFVRRSIDLPLDWTPETLPILDTWLKQSRGETRPEVIQLIAPAVGAYFGEVLRKELGARWVAPEGAPSNWRLELEGCFLYFNPVGMAVEALQLEDTEGLGAALSVDDEFTDELREHLAASGPVNLEDYYLLATRHEVIDQVVHFLMARKPQISADETSPAAYEAHASKDAPAEA